MSDQTLRNVIEAALLVAGKPLSVGDLSALFDEPSRPDNDTLRAALAELADSYADRAIELKETASGWRVQVRTSYAMEVGRLWPDRPQRYSRALLETLALVAYRQPITRAEIEGVRGVAVNPNILKTLMERNWLRVVGHREVPGRPELLGTTREFLDYFGLKKLDDLPPLAELKALADSHLQLELPGTRIDSGDVLEDDGNERPAESELVVASGSAADETVYAVNAPSHLTPDDEAAMADEEAAGDDEYHAAPGASGGLVAAPPDHND